MLHGRSAIGTYARKPGHAKGSSRRKLEEDDAEGSAAEVDEEPETETEESVWVASDIRLRSLADWGVGQTDYTSSSIKSLSIPPPPPLTPRVVSRQPFLRPGRRGTRQPPHTPWKFNEVGQEFVEIVREQSASRQAETGYQMWMRAWARLKDMQTKLGFDEETRAKLEVLIFFALKDFDSFLAYPEERWESCVKAHLRLAAREDSRWKN